MYQEFLDPTEESEPENYGDEWKGGEDLTCFVCGSNDLEPTFVDDDGSVIYKCNNCLYEDNEFYPNDAAA